LESVTLDCYVARSVAGEVAGDEALEELEELAALARRELLEVMSLAALEQLRRLPLEGRSRTR
jgi:hypothetical protein